MEVIKITHLKNLFTILCFFSVINLEAQEYELNTEILNNDQFGHKIAVNNDFMAITNNLNKVFIFHYNGVEWKKTATLYLPYTSNSFIIDVDIIDNNISVLTSKRKCYIFSKPTNGWEDTDIADAVIVVDYSNDYLCLSDSLLIAGNNIYFKPINGWENTSTISVTLPNPGYNPTLCNNIIATSDIYFDYNHGAIYLYTKPLTGWQNIDTSNCITLKPSETPMPYDYFGYKYSISDKYVVAIKKDKNKIYIFKKNTSGLWESGTEDTILYTDGTIKNVKIIGDTIITFNSTYNDIRIYPGPNWDTDNYTTLNASDTFNTRYYSLDFDTKDSILVVNSEFDYDTDIYNGSVYTFNKPDNTWNNATETQKIYDENDSISFCDAHGSSVAIYEDYAVVGSKSSKEYTGLAFVFHYNDNNNTWKKVATLSASDGILGDYFGSTVSIYKDDIVIGGFQYVVQDVKNNNDTKDPDYCVGADDVYVFTKPDSGWHDMTETAKLSPSDTAIDYSTKNAFGSDVCIYDSVIAIARYVVPAGGDNKIFIYKKPIGGWIDTTEVVQINQPDSMYKYANSISIYKNNLAVCSNSYDYDSILNANLFLNNIYIYEKPLSGWQDVYEAAKINILDTNDHTSYYNVKLFENTLITNFKNKIYVYEKPNTGWIDTMPTATLSANSNFSSISIYDTVIIGAIEYQYNDTIFIFKKNGINWIDKTASDTMFSPHYNQTSAGPDISCNYIDIYSKDIVSVYSIAQFFRANIGSKTPELNVSNNIILYPNPANNYIILDNLPNNSKLSIDIINIMGKTLYKNISNNSSRFIINVDRLEKGIYFIRIKTKDNIVIKKFIKE